MSILIRKSSSERSTESIGNYLKNEHSLVMRDKRSNRFSEKFRDSTVSRILSGATTIAQVRKELNVSEQDIVDWIASLALRKQERLDELVEVLGSIQADLPEQFKTALELASSNDVNSGNIVEGRVVPR